MSGFCLLGLVSFGLLFVCSEGVRPDFGDAHDIQHVGAGRFRLHEEVTPQAYGLLEKQSKGVPELPDHDVLQAAVAISDRLVRYWEPVDEVKVDQTQIHRAMYTAVDQHTGEDVMVTLFYVFQDGNREFLTLSGGDDGRDIESLVIAEDEEEQYLLSEERQCHLVHSLLEKARSKKHPAAKRILDCLESHVADGSSPAFIVTQPGKKKMDTELRFYSRATHDSDHDRAIRLKTAHEAAMQMLSLVDLMSGEGIVHHDINPKNLLFQLKESNIPEIQMTLVGWNHATDANSRNQAIQGCKDFMGKSKRGGYTPPEGCKSDDSSAYDIFSVGVLLAEWLAPYLFRVDPHWIKLWKSGYETLSGRDIDDLQFRSLRENFLFPDSDTELLKRMLTAKHADRPTAKVAAAMLYPEWLQKLAGDWVSEGSPRKYSIKHLGEPRPASDDTFYEFYPIFAVEVYKESSLKGEGAFAELDCLPAEANGEDKGDARCCRVHVDYKGKFGVFPKTCDVTLLLCRGANANELKVVESAKCFWKPDSMVKKITTFTRAQ